MSKPTNAEEARREVDQEFNQVRKHLEKVREALQRVEKAGPLDDVHGLLEKLEDTVKEVRTGGLIGSGAKGHRKALEQLRELGGIK